MPRQHEFSERPSQKALVAMPPSKNDDARVLTYLELLVINACVGCDYNSIFSCRVLHNSAVWGAAHSKVVNIRDVQGRRGIPQHFGQGIRNAFIQQKAQIRSQ